MWSEWFKWDFIQTWRKTCEGTSSLNPCRVGGHNTACSWLTVNGSVWLGHRTSELVPLEVQGHMRLCNLLLSYASASRVLHSNFLLSLFPQSLYYANMHYEAL